MGTTVPETAHVECLSLVAGEKPRCICGQPWPCARDVTDPVEAYLATARRLGSALYQPPLLAALEAVLALAAKHEHGALRWQDPLPVPEWIPQVRGAIAGALKVSTSESEEAFVKRRMVKNAMSRPVDAPLLTFEEAGAIADGFRREYRDSRARVIGGDKGAPDGH
jgi:hypothetical protein